MDAAFLTRRHLLNSFAAFTVAGSLTKAQSSEFANLDADRDSHSTQGEPPRDDRAFYFLWGQLVPDPFRPFEIKNPKTEKQKKWDRQAREWRSAQATLLKKFTRSKSDELQRIARFITPQLSYKSTGPTQRFGNRWFRWQSSPDGDAYQVAESRDGPWEELINRKDQKIGDVCPSPDGKWLAIHCLDILGDFEGSIKFMNVDTGEEFNSVFSATTIVSQKDLGRNFSWRSDSRAYYLSFNGEVVERLLTKLIVEESQEKNKTITFELPPGGQRTSIPYPHYIEDKIPASFPQQTILKPPEEIGTCDFRVESFEGIEFFQFDHDFVEKAGVWMRSPQDRLSQELIPTGQEIIDIVGYKGAYIYAITLGAKGVGQLVRFHPLTPDQRELLVPEKENSFLRSCFFYGDKIYLRYRENVSSKVLIYNLEKKIIMGEMPLEPQTTIAFCSFTEDQNGFDVYISSFTKAESLYHYDSQTNQLHLKETPGAPLSLEGCIVEQKWAVSRDGTKIPMTVIRDPKTKLDGTAAIQIYSYGGFATSLLPALDPDMLVWLQKGGIYVRANLRGGGEFGQAWHDAGRREKKKNTFDDLIACTGWLHENNYSSPERTAIRGHSHGGLVVLAAMVQAPNLFNAVLAEAPRVDMLAEESGQGLEYGNARDSIQLFRYLRSYSPLHNIKAGTSYPPHVIWHGSKDNRVPPWHSQKFVATMRSRNPDSKSFLNFEEGAIHFDMTSPSELPHTARRIAERIVFIESAIGPINQKEYRNSLTTPDPRSKASLRAASFPVAAPI